jgi:hypothetical protein
MTKKETPFLNDNKHQVKKLIYETILNSIAIVHYLLIVNTHPISLITKNNATHFHIYDKLIVSI